MHVHVAFDLNDLCMRVTSASSLYYKIVNMVEAMSDKTMLSKLHEWIYMQFGTANGN